MPQNHHPNDSAFEHFFPEERREDDTDPGMTIAAQPAAYIPPSPAPRQKSLAAPLIAFGVALLGLAVVGFLVVNNLTGSSPTRADAPAPGPSPAPTSAVAPSSSSAESPSSTGSSDSSTGTTPSRTSSRSPSSTTAGSTRSGDASSASAVLVSLPRSQTACGSPSTYSTTGAVSCGFADSIYAQAAGAGLADGQSTSFPVTSQKSEGGNGLTYNVSCTHQPGSFITCTAVSEPDNGLRPEVFIMPTQR